MYSDPDLNNKLKYSHTIDSEQAVWTEWNMNQAHNILKVGNYRYRPGSTDPLYGSIKSVYDPLDVTNDYTGATDSDIVVNAGFDDSNNPAFYTTPRKKMNLVYSLDDCFRQDRPRSGINKILYLGQGQHIDGLTSGISQSVNVSRRPRYYMSSRYDDFKYWTSYRTEVVDNRTSEYGVSLNQGTGSSYYIYDAAPFVVYNDPVPANRITIKMQTNVGEVDNGPFRVGNNDNVPDPLYGLANRTVPRRWAVQALNANNQWVEIKSFTENETRSDGSPIIASDGIVELEYGLTIPSGFEDFFTFAGAVYSTSMLPDLAPYGYAYLYKTSDTDIGSLYVSDGSNWLVSVPEYEWRLSSNDITRNTSVLKKLVDPDYFMSGAEKVYREIQFVYGLRIVVDTMNKSGCTFDLIELSPRLMVDISNMVLSYNVSKTLADLGNHSMPTGNLLASTGSVSLFDADLAFNENNTFDHVTSTGSLVSSYAGTKLKFLFYDIIKNVNGYDYYIPVKTLYTEKVPQVSGDTPATLQVELRDLFYLLESKKAPELLLTNVSVSYATTVLLDSIGFSNYTFKRVLNEEELIIPFFFVGPDLNVAEVLQQLAISSQSAMFFNEFNDLVVMSKNYILPDATARPTDLVLYGQETVDGLETALPNIINLSSQEKKVYNGGDINYTTRYIQKSIGSIAQAPYIDEYKSYVYKPVLLWEVAGQESTKTINESAQQASGYSLSAMPLKTTIPSEIPRIGYEIYSVTQKKRDTYLGYDIVTLYTDKETNAVPGDFFVVSGVGSNMDGTWELIAADANAVSFATNVYGVMELTSATGSMYDANQPIDNSIIDFGESIYWLGNYSGYFYANGEVIRYDAVEYSVAGTGNVWIASNQEYQDHFSKLRFNGKMYPTGRVRIYTNIQGGEVKEHGRGQFGTDIVEHRAGIPDSSPWVNDSNVKGSIQNAKEYLFNTNTKLSYPNNSGYDAAGLSKVVNGETFTSDAYAVKSTRNGIIKNFMANTNLTENETNYFKTAFAGSVQTSALVFNGPTTPPEIDPADFVTYAYNTLDKPFKHFGTRARIIGRVESGTNRDQTPVGAFDIYSADLTSTDPTKQVSISGGSAGIAFGLNKDTNIGYYYEIAALSQNSVSTYKNNSNAASYTVATSPVVQSVSDVVTVTLTSQHDFEVGEKVLISGIVDDNRKARPTAMNGEYAVTAISADRKQFTYSITAPTSPASITAVSRTGSGSSWTITYTASNNFRAGMLVTITGLAPAGYNLTNAVVETASDTSFTVFSTTDPGAVTDGVGTATYVPLSTIASTGGTVTKILDENTLISDVFLYKIVSGSITADIIKKARAGTLVTLTTLREHQLVVGESVTVTGVDAALNGTFIITAVTSKTIQYNTAASGTIAETDLSTLGLATSTNRLAIPEILWRGFTEILVDDGKFTSQSRLTAAEQSTVYDMSVEYLDIGTTRQFYLYLNGKQIAVVNDTTPLPQYNNVALFVRGSTRAMFENVYALSDNFAENTARALQLPISKIFGDELVTESDALNKYALSGIVQNTYLSGISSETTPLYNIYYEEFGTIMREAAYFNIKYDRAFPALYAQLAPTLNRARGYTVSGFFAGSYGAEFLIFNAVDKNLNLDDTSGNYLRILGIAFTQNTSHTLKVDDFFKKNSNFTTALYSGESNSEDYKRLYADVLNSRNKYGRNDFVIEAPYVQTDGAAEDMMDWIIKKVIYPRKTVGINTFATPHVQLGDIVEINYKDSNGMDILAPSTTRFVVYNIEKNKDGQSATDTIYLAEV